MEFLVALLMPLFGADISRYQNHIADAAARYEVSPNLIAAVIDQESGGNPIAIRWEEGFFLRYLRGKSYRDLPGYWPSSKIVPVETELQLRSFSWGLMQCMGQTAREFGFDEDWLTELLNPSENIDICTKILAYKIKQKGSVKAGLLAYNGGKNTSYPDRVLARMVKGTNDA